MLVRKTKIKIFSFRLASLIILAWKMIGYVVSQTDDSDLIVLSRKVRYALFPEASTMGVCILEWSHYCLRQIGEWWYYHLSLRCSFSGFIRYVVLEVLTNISSEEVISILTMRAIGSFEISVNTSGVIRRINLEVQHLHLTPWRPQKSTYF